MCHLLPNALHPITSSARTSSVWRQAERDSRNGRYGILDRGTAASVRLDVGRPNYLAPLLGFFGDELAEVGRRAHHHRAAQVGKPCFELGVDEARVDCLVEFIDHFGRRVLGHADAMPRSRFVARQESSMVGMSGSA